MPDKIDETLTNSYVTPLNGERVTSAMLYKALYDLDQGLAARFTSINSSINSASEAIADVRIRFASHASDGHPYTQRAEIIKQEITLDAKKTAVVAALLTIVTTALTILTRLVFHF